MQKQILYVDVSPSPSYGGSKRVLTNIFAAIDRTRWVPHVLYYRDGPYATEVAAMGVSVQTPIGLPGQRRSQEESGTGSPVLRSRIAVAGMRRDASGWVIRSWPRRMVWELRTLYRFWLRGRKWSRRLAPFVPDGIDLIHFNGPMHEAYFEWVHLARRLGVPFVTHEHGPWRIPPVAFRLAARRAASVLCLTEKRVEEIHEFCGARVHADLVPNGVSVEKLTPRRSRDSVRQEFGVDSSTLLLVTPAHIQAYKGQLLAVDVAGLLAKDGLDFRWVFCGAHLEKEYVEAVTQRIRELGLERKIVIQEERADLPDLLAAADLLVHTSIGPEAFGMVVVEAMGVGTAVIGPGEGAVPSIMRDGIDGLLYEPRNERAMADVILRLAHAPEERKRMGANGRVRAAEAFSVEAQVGKLCAVYQRALDERRHPGLA
jgi:glycosyltransferase involved in cell wall biosynthesis